MTIHNVDIAKMFEEIADLLELENTNPFRVRAYRTAAQTIKDLPQELSNMIKNGFDPDDLPAIGPDLAKKIREVVKTGKMHYLDYRRRMTPPALIELLKIPGLGPKRVQVLHKKLGINSLRQLKEALDKQKIRTLDGFSEKSEDLIREGLGQAETMSERLKRSEVEPYVNDVVAYLEAIPHVSHVTVCGSYRRISETIGDLDIVATSRQPKDVIKKFTRYSSIKKIIAQGETRSSVLLHNSLQVDLRVVPHKSYGAATHYFTGSKAHVVELRQRAIKKGLKINEYGVFKNGKSIAGTSEESVYTSLELDYIPPELRENRGEIEAAVQHKLPRLVELKDLKGDLHTHTRATDGNNSLKEMAEAAKKAGLTYIANTDHSKRMTMSHGFTAERLKERIEEINELNEKLDGITILKGIEVDILEDGSLDLPDQILRELDIVIASIHSNFKLSTEKQTKRLLKAIENPSVTMIGHLTGRLINERAGCNLDIDTIFKAIKTSHCILELNSDPSRLDIDDIHCKLAKGMGILVSINSDAHSTQGFAHLKYGLGQARRGWIEKENVLNTRSLTEVRKLLSSKD